MQSAFRIHNRQQIGETGRVGIVKEIDFQAVFTLLTGKFIPVRPVDGELHQLRSESGTSDTVYDNGIEFSGSANGGSKFLYFAELAA